MRLALWKSTALSVLLLCSAAASAQEAKPARYAILSLLGDRLTLVVYSGSTGTNLPPTRMESVPATSTEFDDDALHGAAEAVSQSLPGADAKLFTTNDQGLYRLQGNIFGQGGEAKTARELVSAIVKDASADTIIVLTKFKNNAQLKMPTLNRYAGEGELEGIGYYVDDFKRTRSESGARGRGFLASYCYVKATMLDAKTLQVLGETVNADSEATVNVMDALHAWSIQTEEQKEASLRRIVRLASHDAVVKLMHTANMATASR